MATATNFGANKKCMSRCGSALYYIVGVTSWHVTAVAMQALLLMCCMGKVFQSLGVAGAAEPVAAIGPQGLCMHAMAIKTTDVFLAMPGNLPFLECPLVAVLANPGGDGQGHLVTLSGMALLHDAMTGLAGNTFMGVGSSGDIHSRGVANQARSLASNVLPGLLEVFSKREGMR